MPDALGPEATAFDSLTFYVGDSIEYESERLLIRQATSALKRIKKKAVILANFHVLGRQVDLAIATADQVFVLEAKSFLRPVRGGLNGAWETLLASGAWKTVGNPYLQVLSAAHAIRDAMTAFAGESVPYPEASVVITPRAPPGSDYTSGDYKASVIELDELSGLLKTSGKLNWSHNRWIEFAEANGLKRQLDLDCVLDQRLSQAHDLLSTYRKAFWEVYSPLAERAVSDTVFGPDGPQPSEHVIEDVLKEGAAYVVTGPSGCGKSLLGIRAGLAAAREGHLPIVVAAKYYDGQLRNALERETALLGAKSAGEVISAATRTKSKIFLIVDGYNECATGERFNLTRSVAALINRYGASVLLTTQVAIERDELLLCKHLEIRPPTQAVKEEIALASRGSVHGHVAALLALASSGLEARLVGESGQFVRPGASRFALFDTYTRYLLGSNASAGIGFLAAMAGELSDRIAFSVSVRDLDRLFDRSGLDRSVLARLISSRLLQVRGDRASFGHELHMSAFTAESVVRRCGSNAGELLTALEEPRYSAIGALIVGALDDPRMVTSVVSNLRSPGLLKACAAGDCGVLAREIANEICQQSVNLMVKEASAVKCAIEESALNAVAYAQSSLAVWTSAQNSALSLVAEACGRGAYLDEIMQGIALLDATLAEQVATLRSESLQQRVDLKCRLFSIAYVLVPSPAPGLSRLISYLHNSGWRVHSHDPVASQEITRLWESPSLTNGQLYFLLMISKGHRGLEQRIAQVVVHYLRHRWRDIPYHLQLDLLNFANWVQEISEETRCDLVSALEDLLTNSRANPWLSSLVFEALGGLGALHDSERAQLSSVRVELKALLDGAPDEERCSIAWSIYSAQFDHPLSNAYIEAISEISQTDKAAFLWLACLGAPTGFGDLFLSPLIAELAQLGNPEFGEAIGRFTGIPGRQSIMPQETIKIFVTAHLAMAHLRLPLPIATSDVDGIALAACGQLHYWNNRADVEDAERMTMCTAALDVLLKRAPIDSISALRMCEESARREAPLMLKAGVDVSFMDRFPITVAQICRQALRSTETMQELFDPVFDKMASVRFAIQVLGRLGSASDGDLLRSFVGRSDIGPAALEALRSIDERF